MSLKHKAYCFNMYLNVNLTTPSTSPTPKTPEILNSLISLTCPPLPPSYTSYQRQANRDVRSPSSSNSSPTEEVSATRFGSRRFPSGGSQPPGPSDPGGKSSRPYRGTHSALEGTPSPPVPELPSPVSTVEATKSALIKEGLKHQIKSKLQAAGHVEPQELLSDTYVKEEYSDSEESLTPQDEERRLRRRERNKIAATKCRNKKKERTNILMSESESVEDQNIRLKSEIQRLTSEKLKLEKLLDDPSHIASCRHSCSRSSVRSAPPLVVITSPPNTPVEAPLTCMGMSPNATRQPFSEQTLETSDSRLLYCSPNISSSCESASLAINESSPSSSYHNMSSSSISPCRLPDLSPSHGVLPKIVQQTTPPNVPTTSYCNNESSSFLDLTRPKDSTPCMSLHPSQPPETYSCYSIEAEAQPIGAYAPIKSSPHLGGRRHQPYSAIRHNSYSRQSPYPCHSDQCGVSTQNQEVNTQSNYLPNSLLDESGSISKSYLYSYESESNNPLSSGLSISTTPSQPINTTCNLGKIKTSTHNRYTPYNRPNRTLCSLPTPPAENPPDIQNITMPEEFLQQNFDFQNQSSAQFLSDLSNNFYPPCTFGEL